MAELMSTGCFYRNVHELIAKKRAECNLMTKTDHALNSAKHKLDFENFRTILVKQCTQQKSEILNKNQNRNLFFYKIEKINSIILFSLFRNYDNINISIQSHK